MHRDYSRVVHKLSTQGYLNGIAHITGGGFEGNLPRILPPGIDAVIRLESWKHKKIFEIIQQLGAVPDTEMRRTFNMGIGLILVVSRSKLAAVRSILRASKTPHRVIGETRKGNKKVLFA